MWLFHIAAFMAFLFAIHIFSVTFIRTSKFVLSSVTVRDAAGIFWENFCKLPKEYWKESNYQAICSVNFFHTAKH